MFQEMLDKLFNREDVETYRSNHEILDELKKTPNLMRLIGECREDEFRKIFSLKGDEKLRAEGAFLAYNKVFGIEGYVKAGIKSFQDIAKENQVDLDEELNAYEQGEI